MPRTLLPGKPYPLGATPTSQGTNFALYSENATAVHVCFFDEERQADRLRPPARADGIRVARFDSQHQARAALRISRGRPVGAREGTALQCGQAARRSLCEGVDAAKSTGRSRSFPTMCSQAIHARGAISTARPVFRRGSSSTATSIGATTAHHRFPSPTPSSTR